MIGTIEAGCYDCSRQISPCLAQELVTMAGQRAWDLHRASLQNVLQTIARSAMRIVRADAASLHFAQLDNETDTQSVHYIYETREGRSLTSPRSNGLGQQALQRRQTLFVPDKELGQDEHYLREYHHEAYAQGMRAMAAIPIFFREEAEGLYADREEEARKLEKTGLLYVGFASPHFFTKEEIGWLEVFAARAIEAICHATYYAEARERARRLDNMHRITRSLADDPASSSLLEEIAGAALNILAADIVSVYEYDQEKKLLLTPPTIAGRLIEADLVTMHVDEISVPALLLKNRNNIYADDATSNPLLSAMRGTDREKHFIDPGAR